MPTFHGVATYRLVSYKLLSFSVFLISAMFPVVVCIRGTGKTADADGHLFTAVSRFIAKEMRLKMLSGSHL